MDEEEVLSWMMVLKNVGRCIGHVDITRAGDEGMASGSLLDGEQMSISDLNFVIGENTIHFAESTVGRRYAGWFIRNSEYAAWVLGGLRASPSPAPSAAKMQKEDKNIPIQSRTQLHFDVPFV